MTEWITDEHGNRASVERWGSEAAARASLATLTDCFRCTDCADCTGCVNCADCMNCTDCKDCIDCTGRVRLVGYKPFATVTDDRSAALEAKLNKLLSYFSARSDADEWNDIQRMLED